MPAAKLHNTSAERGACCGIDGEDARGERTETQDNERKRRERAEDHGEGRKRPDPGQVEALGKKIRHRIAAKFAEIGRDKKGDRREPRAAAERKDRGPVPALAERTGKPGKDEHRHQSGRDGRAVE
jgi:hypothetical protein